MSARVLPKMELRTVLRRPAVPLLERLLFPGLVLLAIAYTSPAAPPVLQAPSVACDNLAVRVITRQEGDTTHFLVDNRELCEVTMNFQMGLVNLKPSVRLPYTGTFPPGQVTEAFSVTPNKPEADWSFTYATAFKLGSSRARHDDSCVYELPFEPGESVEVTQGYNGPFSHQGPSKFAIDWQLPEGTLVRAARGGLVVRTKDDSNQGGASMDFDRHNNYVLIRHDDGTLGQYCHLQKAGVLVRPGQTVTAGDPIAHSGNTGFSSGPHLHFCVFMAKTGSERVSIPVKFRTAEAAAVTLVSGRAYQAAYVRLARAKTPANSPFSLAAAQYRTSSKFRFRNPLSVGLEAFHLRN